MFLLFIFLLHLATSEASFCSSPEDETLYIYPNANNCSVFIACIDYEEYEFECIQAPLFIPWSTEQVCLTPCESVSTTRKSTTRSTYELPRDLNLYPESSARSIVCPPSGDTKAIVMQSCTDYLSCHDGVGTVKTCPSGQEFSPSTYDCVEKKNSDCQRNKMKGSQHIKCRYDKGKSSYFQSTKCNEFKKCENQEAWTVNCARYCHWNNEEKTCEWADKFDCHLTNDK